jgi:hypothetical protein
MNTQTSSIAKFSSEYCLTKTLDNNQRFTSGDQLSDSNFNSELEYIQMKDSSSDGLCQVTIKNNKNTQKFPQNLKMMLMKQNIIK